MGTTWTPCTRAAVDEAFRRPRQVDHRAPPRFLVTGRREDDAVVSYIGRFAPAVAVPLASSKGGEPVTELTSSLTNTTGRYSAPA
jgi:hypothetical protein